jgi:hypothetical protein
VDAAEDDDSSLTLLERQPWKARRHAKNIPLPISLPSISVATDLGDTPPPSIPHPTSLRTPVSLDPIASTPVNIFGLSRHYFSSALPTHDPEVDISSSDLTDGPEQLPTAADSFGPYPNLNSLLLSDWYWNQGTKSLRDFKALVDIVGNEFFHAEDIRHTPWNKINITLSSTSEWAEDDAGWVEAPVNISIPFHKRRVPAKDPAQQIGPISYTVRGFRYRRLMSVIEEKLTNTAQHAHFHYHPFELRWTPFQSSNLRADGFRVYSELYTSDSFLKAHQDLIASPPVPGCSLERVIVALMFWSDATHLTSFGDAKLHPVYLFYGNESKYLRSRPSLNLGAHIAYFARVSAPSSLGCQTFY